MASYLMKYKGTYRILPELDLETNDFPRDANGEIDKSYDDLYISCQQGNKIYAYGQDDNKKMLLIAYIPSVGRGRNIKKVLDKDKIFYSDYNESDIEVWFKFKAKDIEEVAKLLKVRTNGADISPFSKKNLPKTKLVEIPTDKIDEYKGITSVVLKNDLLIIHKITTAFLTDILEKKSKKNNKGFDYKTDMKKMMLSRQTKEYIWVKGFWEEYLKYLKKEIDKYYKEKSSK